MISRPAIYDLKPLQLPTAPPKASDTRSRNWTGGTCQLEALPPDVIADILRDAIERRIDYERLCMDKAAEEDERMLISGLLPAPDSGEAN